MVFFQLRRSIPTTTTTTHPAPHSAILRRSLAAIRYATDNAAASAPLSSPLSLPPAPPQTQSHCSLLASFLAYQLSLADVKFRFLISLSLFALLLVLLSSTAGHIAFSALDDTSHSVHVYSINGASLGSKYVSGRITGLACASDYLVVADDAGDITMSRLHG